MGWVEVSDAAAAAADAARLAALSGKFGQFSSVPIVRSTIGEVVVASPNVSPSPPAKGVVVEQPGRKQNTTTPARHSPWFEVSDTAAAAAAQLAAPSCKFGQFGSVTGVPSTTGQVVVASPKSRIVGAAVPQLGMSLSHL